MTTTTIKSMLTGMGWTDREIAAAQISKGGRVSQSRGVTSSVVVITGMGAKIRVVGLETLAPVGSQVTMDGQTVTVSEAMLAGLAGGQLSDVADAVVAVVS